MEPVDAREIAVSALRAAQSRAPTRTFTIGEGSAPKATVQADGEMIRRVLDNLLDNAIRYSRPDGAVELDVLQANGTVQIDVRDQGPGVPVASRPHLFERFYRGDDARALSDTGAGLGLAIARWVARAHGGDLTLVDGTGTGAVFRLTLPNAQL
jgi:two-component system OmpR family sensor kinase